MFYNGVGILSTTAGFGHSGDDDAVVLKQFQSEKLVKPIESPLSFAHRMVDKRS